MKKLPRFIAALALAAAVAPAFAQTAKPATAPVVPAPVAQPGLKAPVATPGALHVEHWDQKQEAKLATNQVQKPAQNMVLPAGMKPFSVNGHEVKPATAAPAAKAPTSAVPK